MAVFVKHAIRSHVFNDLTHAFKFVKFPHEFICVHSSMHHQLVTSFKNTLQVHS